MKLYAEYIKERENRELIYIPQGFATYTVLNNESIYLIDLYVAKEFRKSGFAWILFNQVCTEAKKLGIKNIITSACSDANNVTESIKVILSAGFQLTKISGNMMYFLLEL